MKPFLILVITGIITGCQPARSDVLIEMVNPELVNRLISSSSEKTELFSDSLNTANPLWVKGLKLQFSDSSKTTILWFDEQDRITGLIEYQNGLVKDSIEFFQNGQRMFTFLFNSAGEPSGPARFFYEDGRVRSDGRYENGRMTGVWRQFKPDGRLDQTHEYDRNGNLTR